MLITTAVFTNPIEAHIVRGRLEVEGIPAFVIHEHHIWANWFYSYALGGVKVQVNYSNISAAKELLEKLKNAEFEKLLEENEGTYEKISCLNCKSQSIEECRFSERIALIVFWIFAIPIPYIQGKLKCLSCGNKWVSKERKSYSLYVKFTAIYLLTILFMLLIEGFNHVCKISGLNATCYQ